MGLTHTKHGPNPPLRHARIERSDFDDLSIREPTETQGLAASFLASPFLFFIQRIGQRSS